MRSVSYGGIRYALQYYEMIEHFKLSSMNTKKRVLERINQITQGNGSFNSLDKTLNRSPQDVQEKFDALKMITNKDLDEVGDYSIISLLVFKRRLVFVLIFLKLDISMQQYSMDGICLR